MSPTAHIGSQTTQYCPSDNPLLEMEKRAKSSIEHAPSCPRCASSNTKFCYYNNYSLSQPRYFCKGCRRYWTKGGSLRNLPVGGVCRKNRRSKSTKPSQRSSPRSSYSQDSNESSKGSRSGSDIDLAVIFTNYLNQNPNPVEPDSDGDQEEANANVITPDSGISSNMCFAISEGDLVEGFDWCQEEKIEEVDMGNGFREFGLKSFLGDHEDALRSHDLQQIETFPSTNLVNDIWSFFDSSGF